ncbi:MAG: helix-turn-helix transcriptional regulator [Clostridia bacterium]|nr:helix-turn-helix transcriptional regulator [Clostridia bacterium]
MGNIATNINRNITLLRRRRGITQKELAAVLRVSCQAVSKWESGKCCPDIELLPTLARYFGISIDQLVGEIA